MSTCEFEWDIDESMSTDEWVFKRIQWMPMGVKDRAEVHTWGGEYTYTTQWLVYISGARDGSKDDWSMCIMPCAPDKSSPCDTPFIEVYNIDRYDEMVSLLQGDEFYSSN